MTRVLLFILLTAAGSAHATTLRYGVVVGSNIGTDPSSGPLPELKFAEEEARRLHGKLVDRCNFGDDDDRSILLIRPTRSQLLAAIERVAAQVRADRAALGEVDALFAFFFTGHGIDGHILLADGPLGSEELARLLKSVSAKLTVGMFDACYSASLDPGGLLEKGVRPAQGADVFKELPEEVLEAEGSIWFVSSGPDEASYEDSKVGGLFTHYFIEALDRATPQGPGIPLDQIWSYARGRTQVHARERNRSQNPRRLVARMKEQGALLFSFPGSRDATLVLGESLAGAFLLSYAGGQLNERIEKRVGQPKALAVYSGRARLSRVKGDSVGTAEVHLDPGDELVLAHLEESTGPGLGRSSTELWAKGELGLEVKAKRISPGSFYGGLAGSGAWCGRTCLQPSWSVGPTLRWDRGPWTGVASLQFGQRSETFPAWCYELLGGTGRVQAGYSVNLSSELRLGLRLGATSGVFRQRYDDGAVRSSWLFRPELSANVAYSISDSIALEAEVGAGVMIAPGGAVQAEIEARPAAMVGLGFLHRLGS